MSSLPIGFIGVGTMGGAVAETLLRSHEVQVYDKNPERIQVLVDKGALGATSARELTVDKSVVCMCLPRSEDVEQVLFGDNGIGPTLLSGSLLIDLTTGDPVITRALCKRLALRNVTFVDASLAGGVAAALAGKLTIYVGAELITFDRVLPVLKSIATKVLHVGPPGCGQVMKLTANAIGAVIRVVTCEAVAMGVANGLSLKVLADALPQSTARSHFAEAALPRYLRGVYQTDFNAGLMVKDLQVSSRLGFDAAVPMQMTDLALSLYQAMADDLGDSTDVDMLLQRIEERSGVRVAGQPSTI